MDNEKKLTGVATVLKTPEGNVKLPRTAAVLVQTSSGSNVEIELAKKVSFEEYDKEIDNILDMFNEFSDAIKEFRYDIGTSANYTELAILNREASDLLNKLKIALEDMDVFIIWEEKWDLIQKNLESSISDLLQRVEALEKDNTELSMRLRILEEKELEVKDVNLASMLASVDVFEMMLYNNLEIDENKLGNITLIYTELLKMEVKGINDMPDIIKERIVKQLLL